MEHMCVCSRHSSQISWKAYTHQTPPMRGMQGPDRLTGETLSLIYTHTHNHACTHLVYLYIMETVPHTVCTVCTQQCMHTDIRRSIIQNITLIPTSQWVSTLLNSAPFWRCCSWYIQLVKYIVLSILLHKRITSYQSDFELWRSNSQQQSVNHFFSGFFRHFILRQIQLQCTAMVCILHGDESFSWWFRYYLHPCSICDTFTYFV